MVTSLTLAILASSERIAGSILDKPAPAVLKPVKPGEPSVPLAK